MKIFISFCLFFLLFAAPPFAIAQAEYNPSHPENGPQSFICDPCNASEVLLEDFETYPAGSFPGGNWSYTGNADILVDNTISHGGVQSLRLNGTITGCWEAIACLPLPVPATTTSGFLVEFYFYIDSNHQQGCHGNTFYCNLTSTNNWSTWTGATLFSADYSGTIFDRAGASIGAYNYDSWYKMKVRYDRINVDSVSLHYWLDNVGAGTQVIPASVDENSFVYLTIGSGDGSISIDSLRFLECASLPVALFNAPHHLCPGTCTSFSNLSQNATSYQWSFPGATPSSSTDVNPAGICYYSPGNYDVSLIASNANGSDTTTLPNFMTVYPFSPPQSISQSWDTLLSNTGFVAYQWFYNGDTIPGATNYFYVAPQSGDYSLICIDANGCSVEAVVLNVTAEVPLYTSKEPFIALSPNPATDEFTIHFSSPVNELVICNLLGEKIYSASQYESKTQTSSLVLDISSWASGVYMVKAWNGENQSNTKLIVE